jgi:GT2 family glycosyltransferase
LAFRRLVDSIEKHTPMIWELVVSDAGDIPIEDQEVATDDTWPKIVVLPERPRLGCTRGYNRAFRAARGKWVIWLNDDVEVQAGWAEVAIAFMERHSAIGLGAIYYDEPPVQPLMINHAWGMPYANFGILRRELGNRVGWFDEDFEMYGNDNSLTFRILLAGFGVAPIPGTAVRHHSEKDAERLINENHSAHLLATTILEKKYLDRLPEMRETYERTRVEAGL